MKALVPLINLIPISTWSDRPFDFGDAAYAFPVGQGFWGPKKIVSNLVENGLKRSGSVSWAQIWLLFWSIAAHFEDNRSNLVRHANQWWKGFLWKSCQTVFIKALNQYFLSSAYRARSFETPFDRIWWKKKLRPSELDRSGVRMQTWQIVRSCRIRSV